MDKSIENIIALSNIMTVTKAIVKQVGFELQAPLEESVLDEIISSVVLEKVGVSAVGAQ